MLEFLQPISWLLHACHDGCYNQMCGYNVEYGCNCFSHVMVVSTKKHTCYYANSKAVSTKLVLFVWVNVQCTDMYSLHFAVTLMKVLIHV